MTENTQNMMALKELSLLREQGHLSEKEFIAQKKLLLGDTAVEATSMKPTKKMSKTKIAILSLGALMLLQVPIGCLRANLGGLQVAYVMEKQGLLGLGGLATASSEEIEKMVIEQNTSRH